MVKSREFLIGAVFCIVAVVLFIVIAGPSHRFSHSEAPPAVPPPHQAPASPPVEPAFHVPNVLVARAKDIRAVLNREFGPGTTVKWEKRYDAWVARKGALTVEVGPFRGKVLSIVVTFEPPVPDWRAALATVGLDPSVGPTKEAPFQLHWENAFTGIDWVMGFYPDEEKPKIKQLTIIPDKAAEQAWGRGEK
jgi:hypothetical protein